MLFNIKVFKFWVMETINIYDFLHLLSLIKIRLNMDFGGDLAFAQYIFFSSFFLKESGERFTSKNQTKK
jgi:hypothetical protein